MSNKAVDFQSKLASELGAVVFGAQSVIQGLAVALVTGGHVLLQGVPGVGKTLLAKALAGALGGSFKRIQCTADLMPSDMVGLHVFDAGTQEFKLLHGPLFADIVLVDEINRTGPKTQSALLQAMEEGSITIDRVTYPLSEKFFVIATQNPFEFEGTYPLPESQLDRFLLRLEMGYPQDGTEEQVLRAYDRPGGGHDAVKRNGSLVDSVQAARDAASGVHVSDALYRYVLEIAAASRGHGHVSLGLSTRGALALMRCARTAAALRGGEFVTPDDVKALAVPVMAHRLVLTPDAALEGIDAAKVVGGILEQIAVPRE